MSWTPTVSQSTTWTSTLVPTSTSAIGTIRGSSAGLLLALTQDRLGTIVTQDTWNNSTRPSTTWH